MERLQPWDPEGVRLESFAPEGFETYARVLNPARPAQASALGSSNGVRWGDLAAAAGVELLPDVAFCEVSGVGPEDPSGLDDLAPMDLTFNLSRQGGLSPNQLVGCCDRHE